MTFGEKLSRLRKENNYTQEQLAAILEVSRQSVSKWESDLAYPETEKLIRMAKLFDCSTDYLLKEECDNKNGYAQKTEGDALATITVNAKGLLASLMRERKSEKMIFGMPLYHIGKNARGFFALGYKARGFFSLGLMSRGIFSLGLLSLGVVSIGLLSLGLLSAGIFSAGIVAAGSIALGLLSAGAISIGVISFGALSVGEFSVGAYAIGEYVAVGDTAKAMIAVGESEANGSAYSFLGELTKTDISLIKDWLDANVPSYLSWAKEIFKFYIS